MANAGLESKAVVRITLVVAGVALLLYGIYLVREVVVLVLVALFLAVGLDPLVRALQSLRFPRGLAVASVFLGAVLVVVAFVASVTPPLVRETRDLAVQVPGFVQDLSARSEQMRELDERFDISARVRGAIDGLPDLVASSAGSALGFVGAVGRAIFSLVTVVILTIYFMLDLPKLIAGAARLVPRSRRQGVERSVQVVFGRISGYMMGQLVVSLVAGVISIVVLSLLRVPHSLPLGIWVGLAALIPMVGSTLGAIPAFVVGFFASPWIGAGVVVFYVVYQQFENYVVVPRVMRQAVDISPAAVILAALVGALLLGFIGALIAIPIAASIKVLTQEIWIPAQESA